MTADGIFAEARGWSDVSQEEAEANAHARAAHIHAKLTLGSVESLRQYDYGDGRPLIEEIIDQPSSDGDVRIVVSRNRYGALVLNNDRVMFVDIDEPPPPRQSFFARLFQRQAVDPDLAPMLKAEIMRKVEGLKDLHAVLYKTKRGFRLLILNTLIDPTSQDARKLMDYLGADPLYIRLTKNQACFRARLSPKPWRCKIGHPHSSFPRVEAKAANAFFKWERRYTANAKNYATCALLGEIGSGAVLPEAAQIRSIHDAFCLNPDKPLA